MAAEYDKQDPETIQAMFDAIAKPYDRANAILSLGLHRYWNRALVRQMALAADNRPWLDLCAGTGDIAFAYLKQQSTSKRAMLVDFSSEMLACAREKANKLSLQHHQLSFIQADVQKLPLESASVGVASIAYGIRNVKEPKECLKEVYRVLAPGGLFGILELTVPSQPILRWGHALYLRHLLPPLGKWCTDNREAYRYLCQSIQTFSSPLALEEMMREVGFKNRSRRSLTFGTATILIGQK